MTKYLITVGVLMATVLVAVVVAFVLVQVALTPGSSPASSEERTDVVIETGEEAVESPVPISPATTTVSTTSNEVMVPPSGIPLRSIPLNDTQRSLLKGVGIEYETFVIQPAMIECAKQALGRVRFEEIIDGAMPSVLETMSLVRCL